MQRLVFSRKSNGRQRPKFPARDGLTDEQFNVVMEKAVIRKKAVLTNN